MNIRRQSNTFHFEEGPFTQNVKGISKFYPEVLLLMKISQIKPQIENMNFKYYDFYFTVINKKDEKETVNNKNEKKRE